ncbi:hypothetical protein B0T09DRAFT_136351 [Sordaria sp. MPI-SDFR-AT-0083]|nr:hypothetical protein B0T09DRAFT_136351 [Sordaria sp. MPI-SDFR-AT-0083]
MVLAACPFYLGFGICFTTQPTDRVEDMIVIEKIVPRQTGTNMDYTSFDSSSLIVRGLLFDGITAIDMAQVFSDWATKSESSGTVKHHAQLIRRSAWWIYFDRPLPNPPPDQKNVGVLMVRLVGLEARQTRWRRMGFFLLRSKRGLIPDVKEEWPERFATEEEAQAAVDEVRGRRGTWPLLRLV